MPQEIPLRASETLEFTPASLAHLPDAPTFRLRACTRDDKRFQRRLSNRMGLTKHSADAFRAEVMRGYEAISPDEYAQHADTVRAYWEARDEFALQQKDDPDLVWAYDPAVERAAEELVRKMVKFWPALGDMISDNSDFDELSEVVQVAVVVLSWTGLAVEPVMKDGYLTSGCVEDVAEALAAFERKNGLEEGAAWQQLALASFARMHMSEDEAKNFVSPSPSPSPRKRSTRTRGSAGGKSPAPARSKKIRASA